MANTDYTAGSARIRPGTYTEQDITAAYAWTAFPQQSDQPASLLWWPPVDPSDAVSEAAEFVSGFGAARKAIGGYEGTLILPVLTPGMVTYLKTYLLEGGYSNTVTLMVWDRAQGWIVLNAVLVWNDPSKSAEASGGVKGYMRLKLDYHSGNIANYGREFSAAFSGAFG